MPYTERALHRIGGNDSQHYCILPDIYGQISSTVQVTKVSEGQGRSPRSVGELVKAGVLRRFRARVKISSNKTVQRFLYCANDQADNLGGVIGKNLPANGTVEAGQIVSVSLPRRRRLI